MKRKDLKKWGRKGLAALLSLAMCVTSMQIPAYADLLSDGTDPYGRVADGDTSKKYEDAFAGKEPGYVWTDKTVKESDDPWAFDVTYSALGSSTVKAVEQTRPVDLIVIMDISGSMGAYVEDAPSTDDENRRMEKTVTAVNSMFNTVLSDDRNRIGMVAFGAMAAEVIPLDHYEQKSDGSYILCENTHDYYMGKNDDHEENHYNLKRYNLAKLSGGVIEETTISNNWGLEYDGSEITATHPSLQDNEYGHNTNIEAGFSVALKMVEEAYEDSNRKADFTDESGRIPVVLLLTDGSATKIMPPVEGTGKDPYDGNPNAYHDMWDIRAVDGNDNSLAGLILLTVLEGAHMKTGIAEKYESLKTDPDAFKMYSVGIGMEALDGLKIEQKAILAPKDYFTADISDPQIDGEYGAYSLYSQLIIDGTLPSDGTFTGWEDDGVVQEPSADKNNDANNKYVEPAQVASASAEKNQLRIYSGSNTLNKKDRRGNHSQWFTYTLYKPSEEDRANIAYVDEYKPVTNGNPTDVLNDISKEVLYQPTRTVTGGTGTTGGLTYTDTIGEGMHLEGPVSVSVQYKNSDIAYTAEIPVGGTKDEWISANATESIVNSYRETVQSGLSGIQAKVTTNSEGKQVLTIHIPEELLPVRMISEENATDATKTAVESYESDKIKPITFTYQVALNEDLRGAAPYYAKAGAAIKDRYWSNEGAGTVFTPTEGNSYYHGVGVKPDTEKTDDNTGHKNPDSTTSHLADEQLGGDNGSIKVEHNNDGYLKLQSTGFLTVTKKLEAADGFPEISDAERNAAFTMRITFTGAKDGSYPVAYSPRSGEPDSISIVGGVAEFTLKAGQSITIKGLPVGARYEVEEIPSGAYYAAVSPSSGVIGPDSEPVASVVVTNKKKSPDPASVSLDAEKRLTADEGAAPALTGGEFTFVITPGAGNPAGDPLESGPVEVSNEAGGRIPVFDNLTFGKTGTYTYTMEEKEGFFTNVTEFDTTVYTITAVIKEDIDSNGFYTGRLASVISVSPGAGDIVFENHYDPGQVQLTLEGRKIALTDAQGGDGNYLSYAGDIDGKFRFKISVATDSDADKADDDFGTEPEVRTATGSNAPAPDEEVNTATPSDAAAPLPDETVVSNDQKGHFKFGRITYTKPGTYQYIIREIADNTDNLVIDGWDFDAVKWLVTVVIGGTEGKPTAESVTYEAIGGSGHSDEDGIVFTNVYSPDEPDPQIEKEQTLTKAGSADEGEKTKDLLDHAEDGDTVTYYLTVSNPSNVTVENVVVTDQIPEGVVLSGGTGKELTLIPGSISDGGVVDASGLITWNLGDMSPHSSVVLSFKARVPDVADETEWTNQAQLGYNGGSGEREFKGSNEVETRSYPPALTIEKDQKVNGGERTKDLLQVDDGDLVTYYLTIRSTGNETAKNVWVTDTVPDALRVDGEEDQKPLTLAKNADGSYLISDGGFSVDGKTVYWYLGDMEPGTVREVSFSVDVPDVSRLTRWDNVGHVMFSNNPEKPQDPDYPIPGDSQKPQDPDYPVPSKKPTAGGPEDEPADPNDPWDPSNVVEIEEGIPGLTEPEKTHAVNGGDPTTETQTVKNGDQITYYITVYNRGGSAAADVYVYDRIPESVPADQAKLTLVKINNNGWQLENDDRAVMWRIDRIEAGGSATVSFVVRVPDVSEDTVWDNVAYVYHKPTDPDPKTPPEEPKPEDPEDPWEPTNEVEDKEPAPGIMIKKEQSSNRHSRTKETFRVYGGDTVTYYLVVTSTGTETAEGVVVTDMIPQKTVQGDTIPLVLVEGSVKPETYVYDGAAKTITWTLGDMEPGESREVQFSVTVPNVGGTQNWINTGSVWYENPPVDPDHPNDPPEGSRENPKPSNEVEIEKYPGSTPPGNPGNPDNPGGNPGTEIPDNPTPLSNFPDSPVPLSNIEDEDVPLAFMAPTTGDNKPVGAAALFSLVALGMMGAFGILALRKDEDET